MCEDRLLEALKLVARLDPELVDEDAPSVAVFLERVSLPSGSVERDHELCPQAFSQRMLPDEPLELRNERSMPAECEVSVDTVLERCDVELF